MTWDFRFEVLASVGNARLGHIDTAHGRVRTPAFMPVGSAGSVKALYPDQVRACGTDIILGNTYHLMLRPGAERIAALGGLHGLIGWDGPILTEFRRLPGDVSCKAQEGQPQRRYVPVTPRWRPP